MYVPVLATDSALTVSKSPITSLTLVYYSKRETNTQWVTDPVNVKGSLTHVSQKSARSSSQSRSQRLDRVYFIQPLYLLRVPTH